MIVYGPGTVEPRGSTKELVQFADVLPTVAELAGIKLPLDYSVDNVSFAPLLREEDFDGRDWIFSYFGDQRFLRTENYLIDGNGQLWVCGDGRDEKEYVDVTESGDPEVVRTREKFERILSKLPAPDPKDKATMRHKEWKAAGGYH